MQARLWLILGAALLIAFAAEPLLAGQAQDGASLTPTALHAEHKQNPMGIDARQPCLSWQMTSEARGARQTAHQIQVAESEEALEAEEDLVWDSGRTASDQSIHHAYEGPELESGARYVWRVRVWDEEDRSSDWSEPAFWEMGLIEPSEWEAQWIEPDLEEDPSTPQPSPMLRHEFEVDGRVAQARLYVTSHGLYEMQLNGERVGDQVFTPGWTSYDERLQYQTYDVTDLLEEGTNAAGAILGDGWYRGYIGFQGQRTYYGETLALLAQLHVTYEDGSTETVMRTGEDWRATTGPIQKSDIYMGETYDARLEKTGWTEVGYDDGDWSGVRVADHSKDVLVAPDAPPVKGVQEIKPIDVIHTPEGDTVLDMGQNMVGWMRMQVEGEAGTEVTLRHAEVLDKEGNFYTENLRSADQTNTYILRGEGVEVYEPHFTFQGFRYVAVSGYPGEIDPDQFMGVVIHSDMAPTGHFESSHPLINQLQHNIVWGQKGNFLDIPTDCPQRDERLGWTGDIQVFVPTANYNMNTAGFLEKWLKDLEADQLDNGSVPHVIPNVLGEDATASAGWADASVIVPWTMYQAYGDERVLETQYESMKAWVDYMGERAQQDSTTHLWDNDFTFGDWLAFNTERSDYPGATTSKDFISTAYFAHSAHLLEQIARVLGKEADAEEYGQLFEEVRGAFQKEFVTPRGRLTSDTQTSYVLALSFDLLPEEMRKIAAERLAEDVREHGHLTTGFLGTPNLMHMLSEYGYWDEAFDLLLRTEYPSWLYPVTMDATTIWERWDGIKPDSTFQDPEMNSFNHYAYGAIGQWLYEEVAGIEAAAPGYKEIRIAPHPGGGLTYARATHHSAYGKIESSWELNDDGFNLAVTIPPNTQATVHLPHAELEAVTESGNPLTDAEGVEGAEQEGEGVFVKLGAGQYDFAYDTELSPAREDTSDADSSTDAPDRSLSAESKLADLLADAEARTVLNEHLPDLMDSPWLSQAMGFPLERAADVVLVEISTAALETVDQELQQIGR